MIRRPQTTGFWYGRLPHWEVEDGRYFVTIHLRGAIPKQGEERIAQQAEELKSRIVSQTTDTGLSLMRTIFSEMEEWLDQSKLNALLNNPDVANMVVEAIQHRIRMVRWTVYEIVVMPSHVHLFLSVVNGTLKESLEDFKRWTGHQAARLIALPDGRFWQDEWFGHWSRSAEQDEQIARYIRQNPLEGRSDF
jgi:REP element-mobilizing transposase RayT